MIEKKISVGMTATQGKKKLVIVRLVIPKNPNNEDHGTVEAWISNDTDYGGNNCEHYCYINYHKFLTNMKLPDKQNFLSILRKSTPSIAA